MHINVNLELSKYSPSILCTFTRNLCGSTQIHVDRRGQNTSESEFHSLLGIHPELHGFRVIPCGSTRNTWGRVKTSWTLLKHVCSLCTNTYTSGNITLVPYSTNGGFHSLMSGDNFCSVNKFLLDLPLKSNPPSTFKLQRY
jgi:hypothetical protein